MDEQWACRQGELLQQGSVHARQHLPEPEMGEHENQPPRCVRVEFSRDVEVHEASKKCLGGWCCKKKQRHACEQEKARRDVFVGSVCMRV